MIQKDHTDGPLSGLGKYYKLESKDRGALWRYYSLYNGARGAWHNVEAKAIVEGEAHKALIIALHVKGKITSTQSLKALLN